MRAGEAAMGRGSEIENIAPSTQASDASGAFADQVQRLSVSAPDVGPRRSADQVLSFDDGIYPRLPATAEAPALRLADGTTMQQIQPIFEKGADVQFTTAAQNAASGAQPDFIMGADGVLRDNPAKTEPPKDGKVNVQLEGNDSEIEAKKMANELQKQAIRSLIAYFQKFNPNEAVPQHWLDFLEKQPDLPTPTRREPVAPTPEVPQQQPQRSGDGGGMPRGGGGGGGGPSFGSGGSGAYRGFDNQGRYRPSEAAPPASGGDRPRLPAPIAGDMEVEGPPTITPEKIDEILREFKSPAAGLGQHIYDQGVKHNINPAVALAFFIQESSAGTAGVATRTNSWGNIKGTGPAGSVDGFRAYNNFKEGVDDWYRLISEKYLAPRSEGGFGAQTLSQIISKYAPSSDNNNEAAYVANVKGMVTKWANG